jgi:integrase
MLRLAHEWKLISRIPRIRLLRGERNREFVLSFEQENLYLATAGDDLRDVGTLLVDTGLRIGEALSLEWPDVHMKAAPGATYGYVKVRAGKAKNSKSRNVPITGAGDTLAPRACEGGLCFPPAGWAAAISDVDQSAAK